MLTVLGGLAEFEHDLISARTGKGCERAKARGVNLARKPKLTPEARGDSPARRTGRAVARNRAHLQRLAQHDFAATAITERGYSRDGLKFHPAREFARALSRQAAGESVKVFSRIEWNVTIFSE